jgi:hypothetical protein
MKQEELDKIKSFLRRNAKPEEKDDKARLVISRDGEDHVMIYITSHNHPHLIGGHIYFYDRHDKEKRIDIEQLFELFDYLNVKCKFEIVVDMGWNDRINEEIRKQREKQQKYVEKLVDKAR